MTRPLLLLLHGYLSGPSAWDPLRRELAGEAETLAPALPGYGGVPDSPSHTLAALADALEGTLAEARPDCLLGHSMGAILALELARRHAGRFRGVGLAGLPVFANFAEGRRYVGANSRVRDRYLRDLATGHARCEWLHRTRRLWAAPASLFLEPRFLSVLNAAFDHSAAAHRGGIENVVFAGLAPALAAATDAPVSLLHGDVDGVAPPDAAAALARSRGWPLRVARGATHELIFTHPRGVARWVRERLLAP